MKANTEVAGAKADGDGAVPAPKLVSKKDLTPLLKMLRGRATTASALWARDNDEEVAPHVVGVGNYVGERNSIVKGLFEKLPEDKQKEWREKSLKMKDERGSNLNQCYEWAVFLYFDVTHG